MVARIARGDVNMPGFDGFAIERQIAEVLFEAATYELLRNQSEIRASCLLYHRAPVQHVGPRLGVPSDLSGRRLFVFQRAEGVNNVWEELSADEKVRPYTLPYLLSSTDIVWQTDAFQVSLLDELAHIRAALFNFNLPLEYATKFLHNRLFDFKPKSFTKAVQPTREFWLHVFKSKIEATIKNEGDVIGWEDDEEIVGPIAFAAKRSLLRALPHLMPPENAQSLYRLVLEHGDFGIHNTSITKDVNDKVRVTSLYDWETGCIVPALLSDPLVATGPVDLTTDENARASATRIPDHTSSVELEVYEAWARHYLKVC
jgi:hypothetical protein